LELAKQEWSALLDLVAGKTTRDVGVDLTWIVVYSSGPAKDLGRYFSNNKTPGSTLLNPKNKKQVDDYNRKLEEIYKNTYTLQTVDSLVKVPRDHAAEQRR
jgi:hypothetical protein